MDEIFMKIEDLLKKQESFNQKVLFVDKDYKIIFQQRFSNFIVNPGHSIKNTTIIKWQNDKLTIENSSLFFYGLYIKKKRNVSQTPMPGVKNAVSDIFKDFKQFFDFDDFNFVPAGREDKDVLNKNGRPFFVEIINPKCNLNLLPSENLLINEFVTLKNFERVHGDKIKKFIHDGETSHKKTYSLFVYCSAKTDLLTLLKEEKITTQIVPDFHILDNYLNKKIQIAQKTPLRVLHRRSNLIRDRFIEIIKYENIKGYLKIKLVSSAGTYIKEFVNGDFGRTIPSLSSILECHCDCVQLDVEEIEKTELPDDCRFN
ncbi:putative pseudouridylate synthase [Pseudoloma neurophilia]|uniref:tRNA pseudouridine(55) synthase n=1 Tax=Pseudoloma neurophilia TaxID=146866 RepID=A0A0R0LV85_9MICR|nr:putative pseudouridylate synthase [Pseudoloma neurophilia]